MNIEKQEAESLLWMSMDLMQKESPIVFARILWINKKKKVRI